GGVGLLPYRNSRNEQCLSGRGQFQPPGARLGEIGEQARSALVEHREAVATGLVAEGTSEPRLADTGWADDEQMVMLAKPIGGGELLEQGAVETAMRTVIDVLDDGGLAQPGFPQ